MKNLKNCPKILSQYHEIIEEQESLGILETVSELEKKEKGTII